MGTTSASTVFCFIANATSAFPAIYTFGYFCAWLIFVNYCAVCIFYPIVLVLHELYFQDEGCAPEVAYCSACCSFCNCGCRKCPCCGGEGELLPARYARYKESGDEKLIAKIPNPSEKRPIDMWFGNQFYQFVHRARIPIIFGGIVLFCVFLATAAQISPDPDPPNMFPAGDNYIEFWPTFQSYFTRFTSDSALTVWVAFGLSGNGIDRGDDHDPTDTQELGTPTYDEMFNPLYTDSMEFVCALCDDIESGARYGDSQDRKVDDTPVGGVQAVQCPFTAFRDWIWSEDPDAAYTLNAETINPRTLLKIDQQYDAPISRCIEEEGYGSHTSGVWPIQGFWNAYIRWDDWMNDEMPVDDPSYSKGLSNFDYWVNSLFYKRNDTWNAGQTTDGTVYDWKCDHYNPGYTPKVFIVQARTSYTSTVEYTEGIDLYEKWEKWLSNWVDGNVGQANTYEPTSDHCEGLSPITVCEAANGCVWDGQCGIESLPYPGAVPAGVKSVFITDGGYFSYYYLQEQLLVECFLGILLALVFAFIILNAATKNYVIATVATSVIAIIVVMIIGFTVMLGWKLGILESIIYVMVVGMSVDYVVHLGEAYLEAAEVHTDRHSRCKDMLETRGFSVMSGAASTLGGIFILFFAFIQFFYKFAVVIFFLISCSLVYSLCFFTAIMDSFGPNGDFGEWYHVYLDIQLVRAGKITVWQCCSNCIVPHDSEHQKRIEHTDDEEDGKE